MKTKKRVREAIERLEMIRKGREMSQEQFAKEIGVSRQTYANWIKDRHGPDLDGWFKIQDYLGGD